MATKDFLLPDLGEGLTEGEIVSWLVAVGDTVEIDDPVAEIETAKAVVEVPSPFAGTVTALHGDVGDEIAVGAPLLTIEVAGPAPAGPGETAADARVGEAVPDPRGAGEEGAGSADESSGNVLVGYGTKGGAVSRRRRVTNGSPTRGAPAQAASGAAAGRGPAGPASTRPATPLRDGRPLAKPPVRKMAKDLGIDLATIQGTGEGGVITREDVQAAAARLLDGGAAAAPAVSAPPTRPVGDEAPERRPLRGVRKAIAEQMTRSRREIPEAVTDVDVDATELLALRTRLQAMAGDVTITPLALLLRIVVAGLRRVPELNASLDTDAGEIVLHRHVNLGFAAQTARGLVVPVIHGADRMTTLELAAELGRLTQLARDGKLQPDQMRGGTFTVSNYGAFGVDRGDMVINHPEAAILGVGRIADKPWVVDGELAVRKVVNLAVAFDHRICDGGEAAGFLRHVADLVEDPALLLADV